jgi:two-component system, NarL family, sensor histidine kinase UhpB
MPAGTTRRRLRGRDRARAATTRRIHRPSRAITRSEAALPHAGGDEHGQALARELHEEMGNLAVLKHSLSLTAGRLAKGRTVEAARSLEDSVILLTEVITSLRHVVVGLHPPLLDEVGFPAAVRHTLRQFARRTGIKVRLQGRGLAAPLPPPHQAALFRALQGALSNVVRHSRAASVTVTAAVGAGPTMVMTIEDDGVGFATRGRAPALSFGLRSMRERMETLGGHLRVRSRPAADRVRGGGTRIALTLPFPGPRG